MIGEIVLPYPHQGQQIVLRSQARSKLLSAGRRWRKTTLALHPAAETVLRRGRVLWGAPTYRQCGIGFEELEHAGGNMVTVRRADMTIGFPGGGRIDFVSLDDPDNARGKTADGLVIDEAGYVPERAYYEVLRPMISDTGGWELLMGTPAGHNWFWREWQAAKDRKDAESWQVPTLGVAIEDGKLMRRPHPMENPDFAFSEAEALFETLPQRTFEQEFLAQFMDDAGAVFRNVLPASRLKPALPVVGHKYTMGVDWGKSNDFTALSVIDATTKQQVALDRFNKIDYAFQMGRLKIVVEQYKPDTIIAEANSMGEPLIEQLRRGGLRIVAFTTTAQSKADIIEGLALALEKGELALLDDEAQKSELQAFGMKRLPGGAFRYEAPEGLHDDCLPPGTLIRTMGGYKPIESISVGEMVLTHLGRYRPVELCLRKPFAGRFYSVKPRGGPVLSLSYNHPLYMARRDYTGDISGPFTVRDWVLPEAWKQTYRTVSVIPPVGELDDTPLLETDFYQNNSHATNVGLREIALDERFASLLGRFIADGHCRKHGIYGMELAFADTDVGEAEPYETYLEALGVAVRAERFSGRQRGFKLVFASKLLWHIFKTTYDSAGERILPEWSWRLGPLLKHALDAWVLADGWRIRGYQIGCTTSKSLALSMRDLAMATGRYASIQILTDLTRLGRRVKDQYWVTVRNAWLDTGHQRRFAGFEYGARADVQAHDYKGEVCNLQVAEDRSFVANGIVVHNCVIATALAWHGIATAHKPMIGFI